MLPQLSLIPLPDLTRDLAGHWARSRSFFGSFEGTLDPPTDHLDPCGVVFELAIECSEVLGDPVKQYGGTMGDGIGAGHDPFSF